MYCADIPNIVLIMRTRLSLGLQMDFGSRHFRSRYNSKKILPGNIELLSKLNALLHGACLS